MIINRSRYVVSVPKHPALTEEFPFNKREEACAARDRLLAKHPNVRITQNEDSILVRIRTKGFPSLNETFPSYKKAELFEAQVMAERSQGVFVDYGKCLHTTVADLIIKFMEKELPKKGGGDNYRYFFQAVLDDSQGLLEKQIEARQREMDETGNSSIKIKAARNPMGALEWIHKPLTEVTAEDIEDWMESRRGDVATSTIWREYEHIRGMLNLAINTWGYHLRVNPTKGVRKQNWSFCNERDRRLVGDEFDRIMAAAQAYDVQKSLEHRIQELMQERLALETFTSASHRKRLMVALRAELTGVAQASYVHRPIMEAFILFQVATAARRAESLTLPWRHVDFEKKSAFLPETKNGLARNLALRDDLIELLKELPRDSELVFNLTVKTCTTAWKAILEAAGNIEDLTIHDLRHEAISSAAESGTATGERMTIQDLQAFSGHRDQRMLARYMHLCITGIAEKLSAALEKGTMKNGRRRFNPKLLKDALGEHWRAACAAPVEPNDAASMTRKSSAQIITFPKRHASVQ